MWVLVDDHGGELSLTESYLLLSPSVIGPEAFLDLLAALFDDFYLDAHQSLIV